MKIFKLTLGLLLFSTLAYADFTPPTANYTADSYTKLLIHGDQADGTAGTDILDSETTPKTITAVANAQVDTAQYKNLTGSTGSILFDGTGDYLSLDDSDDWVFGSGDFTIDCWIRLAGSGIDQVIVCQNVDVNNFWSFHLTSSDRLEFWERVSSSTTVDIYTAVLSWTANTWYHVAVVRSGANAYIYRDGTSLSVTGSWATLTDFAGGLSVGARNADNEINGWIDELRISKGIARDFITTSGKQFIMITKFINNLNPDKIGTPMWSCKIKAMVWWKNLTWGV